MVAVVIGLALAAPAYAATAYWTGRQEQVQTVTGQFVWKCEYNYNGQTFWYLFQTSCPSSVEIQ
jgi:biopolymer transport protein ExbB/TolQ